MASDRICLLLVEDDRVDQIHFQRAVATAHLPYDTTIATSVREARAMIASRTFDVILTDYYLGADTAFDIFQIGAEAPVIFITGRGNEEIAVRALQSGAYDYLIKDPDYSYLQLLPLTVERAIRRWRAERQLQQIQFEQSVAGIFTMTHDGRLVEANDTLAHILGYSSHGELIAAFGPHHFGPGELTRLQNACLSHGSVHNYELQLYRADHKEIVSIQMNASTILREDGTDYTINGSLVDVSPEKRIAHQLEQERTLLAQRIKEHTEAIARANEMALQASLQRRRLVSAACADLSRRLAAIWTAQPPPKGHFSDEAAIIQLMLRALTLMTMQDGALPADTAEGDVIARCRQVCDPLAASLGVAMHYQAAPTPPQHVHAEVLQTLTTLIVYDAIVRAGQGGQVNVSLAGPDKSTRGSLFVEGSGAGVSARSLLLNAGSIATPNLQLIAARRLAELHGGTLHIESSPSSGARIKVLLGASEAVLEQQEAAVAAPPPSRTAQRARPLILLAEDNDGNAATFMEYLPLKYDVLRARNGHEALIMAQEQAPSLIILDIQMPLMDGFEVMRRLRADQRFVKTPIIAVTALAMSGDRDRCLEAGANAYLAKPVRMHELLATIDTHLGASGTFSPALRQSA